MGRTVEAAATAMAATIDVDVAATIKPCATNNSWQRPKKKRMENAGQQLRSLISWRLIYDNEAAKRGLCGTHTHTHI